MPEHSANIRRGKDGVYRWVYEFNLYRNPTILFTVLKIFFVIIAIGIVIMLASMLNDYLHGYMRIDDILESVTFGLLFMVFWMVLCVVGYLLYAAMNGGKYCVMFEMDDAGVTHRQFAKQVEKAQVVGLVNVLAGIATKNATQVGIGLSSARTTMASSFETVRSVQGLRRRQVIKVNEPLNKNQVYVVPEDYDFVFGFIRDHCPNADVRG